MEGQEGIRKEGRALAGLPEAPPLAGGAFPPVPNRYPTQRRRGGRARPPPSAVASKRRSDARHAAFRRSTPSANRSSCVSRVLRSIEDAAASPTRLSALADGALRSIAPRDQPTNQRRAGTPHSVSAAASTTLEARAERLPAARGRAGGPHAGSRQAGRQAARRGGAASIVWVGGDGVGDSSTFFCRQASQNLGKSSLLHALGYSRTWLSFVDARRTEGRPSKHHSPAARGHSGAQPPVKRGPVGTNSDRRRSLPQLDAARPQKPTPPRERVCARVMK